MTFGIRDRFFVRTSICHFPENAWRFPIFVALLFNRLNPVVRNVHRKAIIETVAAVLKFWRKSGHTAHIFGDCNRSGFYFVNQLVCDGQVTNCIVVLMTVEIIAVTHKSLAQAVTVIKHWSYAVKAESVKMELLKPIFAIWEQEVQNIIFSIVKAKTVPSRVFMSVARIEKLIRISAIISQTFDFIFYRVTVDNVHNYADSLFMCRVNQIFQFFRRAATTARCKEWTDMITETAVIRVFLNCHDLYAIIAVFYHTRQNIFFKFGVSTDFFGILRHSDMTFIYKQGIGINFKSVVMPNKFLFRLPNLSGKNLCVVVLNHSATPSGDSFAFAAVPMNFEFI